MNAVGIAVLCINRTCQSPGSLCKHPVHVNLLFLHKGTYLKEMNCPQSNSARCKATLHGSLFYAKKEIRSLSLSKGTYLKGMNRPQRNSPRCKATLHSSVLYGKQEIPFPEPALEKSLLGFFQGLRNRKAIPHAAKTPIHGLIKFHQERKNFLVFIKNRCQNRGP